jgi:transposase-like protein
MNNLGKNNPPASGEVKQKIIAQIRDEGLSVADASRQSGYAVKTIYGWLRKGVETTGIGTNLILENNRLKKELEQAYALLGRAQAIMNRSKK